MIESERIAVIGVATRLPVGLQEVSLLTSNCQLASNPDLQRESDLPRYLAGRVPSAGTSFARFGIPPVQRAVMAERQLIYLEVAEECLSSAGYDKRRPPGARTDVWCGVVGGLDRQHVNAMRIEAVASAGELERRREVDHRLRQVVEDALLGSAHDRVGEMASTIPARIAIAFGLRGRTVAIDAEQATSHVLLKQAIASLSDGLSDAALVIAGDRVEGSAFWKAAKAKGLLSDAPHRPFYRHGNGFALGEAFGAILLRRLSDAQQSGNHIRAVLREVRLDHCGRSGTCRFPGAARTERCEVPRDKVQWEVQLLEASGSGFATDAAAELLAMGSRMTAGSDCGQSSNSGGVAGASQRMGADAEVAKGNVRGSMSLERDFIRLSCVKSLLGNTMASGGIMSLIRCMAGMAAARFPTDPREPEPLALDGTPFRYAGGEAWNVTGNRLRRAAIACSSGLGTWGYMIVEDAPAVNTSAYSQIALPARAAAPAAKRSRCEGIAVVSYGGCFGGAPNAHTLWRNTVAARDGMRQIPEGILPRSIFYSSDRSLGGCRTYCDRGAYVPVPSSVPGRFRVSPMRQQAMDRTQRLALVVAEEMGNRYGLFAGRRLTGRGIVAIGTNLGLNRERLLNVGLQLQQGQLNVVERLIRAGVPEAEARCWQDALLRVAQSRNNPNLTAATSDGMLASGVPAIICNELELDAVPVGVEGACASSLAAIDLGMQALFRSEADYAIVGGVEFAAALRDLVLCSALGLLGQGRHGPFDARANGFIPGDGMAMFVLRRLSDAERDGDRVHAVLRAMGGSNDANSLIAPSVEGQVAAIEQAFSLVEFDPQSVQFLEAHGTGTHIGDQVEIEALAATYGKAHRANPLVISSAKSALGHTFCAAGSAGLLRTVLAMNAETYPPSLFIERVNPELPLHRIPAIIPRSALSWPTQPSEPRRAAVSAFGTGGINYHLLLEQHSR